MDHNTQSNTSKIFVGAILIIIGALFLLRSFSILPFEITYIVFSWRFILFIIGIIILINSENKVLGVILTAVGGILLFPRIFPNIDIDGRLVLGIIIIGLGAYVILKSTGGGFKSVFGNTNNKISKDSIDDVAIFGGGTKVITSDNFKGGNITAIFGGSEIDLTSCKLAEGNNVLDITAIFGGSTIIVPRDWNVFLNVTPIFGGFSNKIKREPNLAVDQSRSLLIKGVALFGGGEIRSYY
jgi:predicted membrane protein